MPVNLAIGLAAAFGAALIGAAWQVATRAGVTTSLSPFDLAVMRYGVPAVVLLPLLFRRGLWPTEASPWWFVPLFLGAGIPFGLLAMAGAMFAPVSHMGALMPGTMPVFTALLAVAVGDGRLRRGQMVGFAVIALGVAAVTGPGLSGLGGGTWKGDLLFLAASFAWAIYTVAMRRSGLMPWHSTALLSASSAIAALAIWFWTFPVARLGTLPSADIGVQLLAQGVMAGLGGLWIYALAIRHLGPQRAALSGAVVPALALFGGWAFLGEAPGIGAILGTGAIIVGVIIAARVER